MTIGERIKYLRSEILSMTQEDFGKELGVKRSNISNMEAGRIHATDRVIREICRIHDVSEKWLRTGEGEMLETYSTDEEIAVFAASLTHLRDDDFRKQLISILAKMSPDEWELVRAFANLLLRKQEEEKKGQKKEEGD